MRSVMNKVLNAVQKQYLGGADAYLAVWGLSRKNGNNEMKEYSTGKRRAQVAKLLPGVVCSDIWTQYSIESSLTKNVCLHIRALVCEKLIL
jgi:hypothetical protein